MSKAYEVTGELNAHVKARLDRADASDCYIDEDGDIMLVGEPFADLSGLAEIEIHELVNPVRCTACGETCEFFETKHDQGYVYCPACVAADPELQ